MGDDEVPPAETTAHAATELAAVEPAPAPREPNTGMSWWTRSWVTLGVLVAMGLTAAGILVVRHVLAHPVDPKAVQQRATDRLNTLDPALTAFTAAGPDLAATVRCAGGGACVSAARHFKPDGKATEATVRDAADAWAGGFGLGSPPASSTDTVLCGRFAAAPGGGSLCDIATYQIPGDESQHVHVYAQLSTDPKNPSISAIGTFTRSQLAKLAVSSVYVQVLGTVS